MEFEHVPVLYDEVMETLAVKPDGIYVDGTVGGGGHSSGICERLSEKGTLIAVDRDTAALEAAGKRLAEYKCNKKFIHANYSDVEAIAEAAGGKVDGILLDLGVSSFQLDNAERGFSYMQDAPMDMRMNEDDSFTAYDVVNTYSEKELTRIIREYGEEKWASRIAQFIVRARSESPIRTTGELTDIIKAAIPAKARRTGPHPAKRTFQAIRIEVNDELGALRRGLEDIFSIMNPKGRFCIITFHSLEDRIVKQYFRSLCEGDKNSAEYIIRGGVVGAKAVSITKKPIVATEEELANNRRSHSAKLRIIEKI